MDIVCFKFGRQLYGVPVEDFAQFVVLGEVLVDQGEKDFGNIGTAPLRRVGENSPLETQCRAIMITR